MKGLLHSLGFALLAIGIGGSDFTAQAASVRGSAATTADSDALTAIDVEHTDKALNTEDDNQRRLAKPTSAGVGKKPKDPPTPPPSTRSVRLMLVLNSIAKLCYVSYSYAFKLTAYEIPST